MGRRVWAAFAWPLALLLAIWPSAARADAGLSIDKELDRPGVRLVAVEFYATWCKPCMDAVPKWQALHEKYRDNGLRLIVVAVQDDGRCSNPGWSPNRVICDEDGRISEAFRVGQSLPAAFLWSWRGKLLVQRGRVEDVQKAVDAELATVPRVTLGTVTSGPDGAQLGRISELVRSELQKTGKVVVVASGHERELLERIRRESQKAGYAEKSQCRLGEEVAANALLKTTLQHNGTEAKLLLQLFSAESGCLLQSGIAPWRADKRELAVAEAVADLIARLRSDTEMPATARPGMAKQPFGGRILDRGNELEAEDLQETVVKFTSTPPAAVFLGDKMLCKQTPCQKAVALGRQSVTMSAEDYLTRTESLTVGKSTRALDWSLQADFATLRVTCGGEHVAVQIDAEPPMACPVQGLRVRPGRHKVALEPSCHLRAEEVVALVRGQVKTVALAAKPRAAVVTLRANDAAGNDLVATAYVDEQELGEVPGSFKVPICGKRLSARSPGYEAWSTDLAVAEGDHLKLRAELRVSARNSARSSASANAAAVGASAVVSPVEAARAGERPWRRFVDLTTATVADAESALEWQKADSKRAVEWQAALDYCARLALRGGGWRLPTVAELLGTVVATRTSGYRVDGHFVNAAPAYWSSSPGPEGGLVWFVNLYDGTAHQAAATNTGGARCVRSP